MNYCLKKIEDRQEKINSVSAKKHHRRNELAKYLRGLFIVLIITLFAVKAFFVANHMVREIKPLTKEDFQAVGKASILYDSKGEKIHSVETGNMVKENVSIEKIPDCVKNAFVANEDKIFYQHNGVNARGVLEDMVARLTQSEEARGTSYTITQQLIENQIADTRERDSFAAKIKNIVQEQYSAIVLENNLSKQEILQLYLNSLSFGKDIVGVQAASKWYFGKDISEVNISEASVLAATAKEPERLNPLDFAEENGKQRMEILKNMLNEKYISEEEYGDALGDDVYAEIRENNQVNAVSSPKVFSYYTDVVLEQVLEDLQERLGYSATEAYQAVYNRGLKIYTCQDSAMQKICDDVANDEKYYPVSGKKKDVEILSGEAVEMPQVSMVLIEQETGEVRAIVGGRGEEHDNREINRATRLERQPGTAFDVLSVYTPALDTSGMTLGTVQDDTAYNYPDTNTPVLDIDGEEYRGLMTIRDAIMGSKAVPTVKTLEKISVQVGYSYLQKFGLTTLVEKKRRSQLPGINQEAENDNDLQLKMGLGQLAEGVTNLEMTSAYAAFANKGCYQTPKFYTKVVDDYGDILLENNTAGTRIMKQSTSWLLTDAMESSPIQLEKDLNNNAKGIAMAGKSGRTAQNTDAWYIGYTPHMTFGIWSGKDDNTPLDSTVYVTTMWEDIMEQVHQVKNVKKASFKVPRDMTRCTICTKCGNLAVEGLCDRAAGGSTAREEFFEKGTEPKKNCTCHVKYRFCKSSNHLATEQCPEKEVYEKILLRKKEQKETKDTPLTPEKNGAGEVCNIHS